MPVKLSPCQKCGQTDCDEPTPAQLMDEAIRAARPQRERPLIEPFTAVADCPKCGCIAVHRWRMPRQRPPDYKPGVVRVLDDGTEIHQWGMPDAYALEDLATVFRVCGDCAHEWPQS